MGDRGPRPQSHATVVLNASVIAFREGLEAILIFAAVTASLLGANEARRKPVAAGAGIAFGAVVAGPGGAQLHERLPADARPDGRACWRSCSW